jgi:hypothetical protein
MPPYLNERASDENGDAETRYLGDKKTQVMDNGYYRLTGWFIVHVDTDLGYLHHVEMGCALRNVWNASLFTLLIYPRTRSASADMGPNVTIKNYKQGRSTVIRMYMEQASANTG